MAGQETRTVAGVLFHVLFAVAACDSSTIKYIVVISMLESVTV